MYTLLLLECHDILLLFQSGADSPPEMSPDLSSRRVSERRFLEQLLDTKKLETYCVRVPINADLRKYQQAGNYTYKHVHVYLYIMYM